MAKGRRGKGDGAGKGREEKSEKVGRKLWALFFLSDFGKRDRIRRGEGGKRKKRKKNGVKEEPG